jgi:hypothetical protein
MGRAYRASPLPLLPALRCWQYQRLLDVLPVPPLPPVPQIRHSLRMADLYVKNLESERKALWATCRLKGLAKGTPERLRIDAIDAALAAHKQKGAGKVG